MVTMKSTIKEVKGKTMRRVTAYLEPAIYRALKILAAKEDRSMYELLNEGAKLILEKYHEPIPEEVATSNKK